MEEILKTTLLEFEKSTFIIDLVEHNNGKQYIQILQIIQGEGANRKRKIKINPSLLSELLEVLNTYQELIPDVKKEEQINNTTFSTGAANPSKKAARTFTETQKTAIQNRYLKGIAIHDLTIQFDCKAELIQQILRNGGIAIVDNKRTKPFRRKK